ncbi:MAG: C40 family peptidase [Brumimicrobium sp.]|nr:C40 family peptidase [Brumimicrobium sp.]MCO5268782.1 C40 family peptidase [Brumimicrobium sp.]
MEIGDYAICHLTVVPVRISPDDTSEIITQLLFGEVVCILSIQNQWLQIEITHDTYKGWVDSKQFMPISKQTAELIVTNPRQQDEVLPLQTPWGNQTILAGSPILSQNKNFQIEDFSYSWNEMAPVIREQNISELALKYLNSPYLWGGRTCFGIDCSGFTQTVYHQLGISLNRDASQQVLQGKEVTFNNQREGDLAFFRSEKSGKITHVGIILENNTIIHAHGRVRIDTLKEEGIYNEKEKYFSHKLNCIKTFK